MKNNVETLLAYMIISILLVFFASNLLWENHDLRLSFDKYRPNNKLKPPHAHAQMQVWHLETTPLYPTENGKAVFIGSSAVVQPLYSVSFFERVSGMGGRMFSA